jgi:aminopeptidase 2
MCRARNGDDGAGPGSSAAPVRELLPANVVPRHYDLTLEPDLAKFTFEGTVVIDVDVAEDSKSISLHTFEIDIHSASLKSGDQVIW